MLEWLKQPGFFGTHATIGADLSQLMAALFTGLFLVGWYQAKNRKGEAHHWLMLGGMMAMLAFFTTYYLFRQLGVLAFEGKEGFGGSQALYDNVFIPLLTLHIVLVIIGLVMALYMIVLGFRAEIISGGKDLAHWVAWLIRRVTHIPIPMPSGVFVIGGKRSLESVPLQMSWARIRAILGIITLLVMGLFGLRTFMSGFSTRKLTVYLGLLALIIIVFAVEIVIQRIWPDGAQRHRVLGRFTMIIYCVLFVTGSVTYTMLYILYPGKIG